MISDIIMISNIIYRPKMLHTSSFFSYPLLSPQRVGTWGMEEGEGRTTQIGWQMKRRKLKGYENQTQ